MIYTILFYLHYALLLLFGILLSAAFSGVLPTKKNIGILSTLFLLCGIGQICAYIRFDEMFIWKIYPLITHLPILLLLRFYYHKRLATALASVCTAYLCCQIAKWFGLLAGALTGNDMVLEIVQIISLLTVGALLILFFAHYMSDLYNRDNRSIYIFGITPMVYYAFDYSMVIYTTLSETNTLVVAEFLPFFLCVVYMFFCTVYYKEYEQNADAKRKEQIISIIVEQQQKEMDAIRRNEQEIRILRHDMRLFLDTLLLRINENDLESARNMVANLASNVESTSLRRFCSNNTVNYILSDFAAKCEESDISFETTVQLEALHADEILFSSILSNALDNALNATRMLPTGQRYIKCMLKTSDRKLLLSVTNPFNETPVLVDGIPISQTPGHGYGTQSIRYMTERLSGNCQFTIKDNLFILRVII